ncbi:MAG: oligosaccharide flippase family protein [Myxococcota bacterium]
MTTASADAATSKQLRGSSLLLAGRLLSKFVNFGIQVAIVRLLSKDDFGVFAFGLALVLAGELVVKGGLGRGANRFVPYHAERGDRAEVMGILAFVSAVIVTLGLVGFAGLVWVAELGLSGMPSGDGLRVVLVLACLAPVGALDTIGIQTLACFARPREILFRKNVLGPALRATAVVYVFLVGGDAYDLAVAYLLGGVVGLVLCFHLALKQLHAHGFLSVSPREWRVPWRPFLSFSLPLVTQDLLFIVFTMVPTAILMANDGAEGVATLRAVVPAAALIGLVVQSFGMLYMPSAMRLHAQGDRGGLHDHHWRSVAWVTVLSFPLFGMTFAVAPALVPVLLGEAYAESARILAVLAVGHYVSVCMAFNSDALQVFARIRGLVGVDLAMMALGVALSFLLCPTQGAMGAAIAITATRIVGTLARHALLARTPGMERIPAAQRVVWGKVALVNVAAVEIGWLWQPPFLIQVGALAILTIGLLRSTAPTLDLTGSFPELSRVPLFARLVGA